MLTPFQWPLPVPPGVIVLKILKKINLPLRILAVNVQLSPFKGGKIIWSIGPRCFHWKPTISKVNVGGRSSLSLEKVVFIQLLGASRACNVHLGV